MKNKRKTRLFKVKYTNYFEARRYMITYNELEFYKKFFEIAERLNMILLTKVSIYNLVNIKDTLYKTFAFKQCGKETIDFIFADKDTCRARMCINLDDPYESKERIKKNQFVNELFKELDINLIRIRIDEDYNFFYLENKLREIIAHSAYEKSN